MDATGLAAYLPQAAPPLGITARLLIAAALALTGALLGLMIARQIGSRQRDSANVAPAALIADRSKVNAAPIGEERPVSRRRPLALQHGQEPAHFAEENVHAMAEHDEAFDLAVEEIDAVNEVQADAPNIEGYKEEAPEQPVHSSAPHIEEANESERVARQAWTNAPLEELGLVQLAQRLGNAIELRREMRERQARECAAVEPIAQLPGLNDVAEAEDATEAMATYFGRRDETPPASADTREAAQSTAETQDRAKPPAVQPLHAHEVHVIQSPASPDELSKDDDEPSGIVQSLQLPHDAATAGSEGEESDPIDEASFPSDEEIPPAPLRPFEAPTSLPVRHASRPIPSNDENERVLRDALINLERMGS